MIDNAVFIPHCNLREDVYEQYEKLIKSIDERIRYLYHNWEQSLGTNMWGRLNRPLLNRSVTRPGLLECNIDRTVLPTCRETQYWVQLGYEVPYNIKNVYAKYDNLKLVYEEVLTVVMDYNRILTSLSDEERILFRQLISLVEKKISPGLSALKWNSDVSDEYLSECCQVTLELQEFVNDYKTCNLQIVKICEQICDMPLLIIPTGHVYDLNELNMAIDECLIAKTRKLAGHLQDIIRYMIVVYEGFESQMNYVSSSRCFTPFRHRLFFRWSSLGISMFGISTRCSRNPFEYR